jgi:CRP-like cAMP-binding protein
MTKHPGKIASPGALELLGAGSAFHDEFCGLLEGAHLFNDLEWLEIEALSNYMQAYRADRNVTLFREGESGDYMCLILKGQVDIYKEARNTEDKIVSSVDGGKTLGEMSMVDGEPRSATAVTAEETTLAILTRANFNRLIQDKPALGVKVLMKVARLLSQRLRRTSGILIDYLEG